MPLPALATQELARDEIGTQVDSQDEGTKPAAQRILERLSAPPEEDADRDQAVQTIAQRISARVVRSEPSVWEKAAVGGAEALASIAQAPDLALKGLEWMGVPRETILQQLPNIAEGAEKLAAVGRQLQEAAEFAAPAASRGEGMGAQLPYAVGAFGPTLAASALGGEIAPLFGLPARIGQLAGVAATGAAQTAVPLHAEVLAATGDPKKAMQAAVLGVGIGMTEIVGAGGILAKLDKATGGGVMRFLGKVATESLEEGLQEAAQQGLTDAVRTTLTPQELTYLQRLERSGQAGAFGLVFGGLIGAAFHGVAEGARAVSERGGGTDRAPARPARGELKLDQTGPAAQAIAEARPGGQETAAPVAHAGAEGVSGESSGQGPAGPIVAERQPSAAPSAAVGTYAHTEEPAPNSSVQPGDTLGPVEIVPIGDLQKVGSYRPEEAKVTALMEAMQRGEPLPPVIVSDGPAGPNTVDDGGHRLEAAKRLGLEGVPVRRVNPKGAKVSVEGQKPKVAATRPAERRTRLADAVDAMRALVDEMGRTGTESEEDLDELPALLQQAERVLDQRGGAPRTEIDETLAELVRMARIEPDIEQGPKEQAQTAYGIALFKKAKAILKAFDASKPPVEEERRKSTAAAQGPGPERVAPPVPPTAAAEPSTAPAEEPAARGVPEAVPEAAGAERSQLAEAQRLEQEAAAGEALTPEEQLSDRILSGEPVPLAELEKAPKAIHRAAMRQQRGEKPRQNPKAMREQAAKIRETAQEEIGRERLENTRKRAEEASGARGRAKRQVEVADVMERIAAAQEAGEAGVLEGVNSRAQVEQLLSLARLTEERDSGEGYKHKAQELPKWGAFVRPQLVRDLVKAIEGKKGAPALRRRIGTLTTGEGERVYNDDTLQALRELVKMAAPAEKYQGKNLLEEITAFERLKKVAGSRDELKDAVEAVRKLRDQAPGLTEEQKTTERIKKAEAGIRFQKIPGFFPTPPALVERVIQEADIEPGMRVLEPSAGKGDLADAAKDAGGTVEVVEKMNSMRGILQAKGYEPVGEDFETFTPAAPYDRIVMNPPFEGGQDIEHVRRAYEMLAPGGRLVSIMSEGSFGRSDRKATEFRAWLDEHGGTSEQIESGAFKGVGAFRETGVATRLVVIDKPAAEAPAAAVALDPVEAARRRWSALGHELELLEGRQRGVFISHRTSEKAKLEANVENARLLEEIAAKRRESHSALQEYMAAQAAATTPPSPNREQAPAGEAQATPPTVAAPGPLGAAVGEGGSTPEAMRARAEELVRAFRVTVSEPEAEVAAPTAPGQIPTGSFRFPTGRVEVGEDHGSGAQVRIFFDAKPTPEKLAELRKAGFRWNGASKAWIIEGGKGGQAKALEITGMDQPQTSTVEERIADLERRIKAKEADRKGRRKATQAGINREIRTLEEIAGKLRPTAEKRRRAREEFTRQTEAFRARERGASTEEMLARIQFADQSTQQEAAGVFTDWVRAEAAGQGLTDAEITELAGEAARFYQLGPDPGGPLSGMVPRKTTMAEYIAKEAGEVKVRAGLRNLSTRLKAATEAARKVGAYVTDYGVEGRMERDVKEARGKSPAERLEAARKQAEPGIAALEQATRAKQEETIRTEVAKEEARWKTLAEGTQEWAAWRDVANPYLKAGFDGTWVMEDPDVVSDGRALLKKSAIEGKPALRFFERANPAARYRTGNPLPKAATDSVWKSAVVADLQPATVAAVTAPENDESHALAWLRPKDGTRPAIVDANRLRAMMRATKADGIEMANSKSPVVITKKGDAVGILMPITMDEPTGRGGAITEALEGGAPAIRKMAAEKLAEAQRAGEEKIRNIGREQPPEDIRKLHAFPGGLLDPLMAGAQRLVDRLRKTPPLQEGAVPLPTAGWTEKAIQRYVDYFEPVQRAERALAGERRPGEANLPDEADAYLQETLRKGRTGHLLGKLEEAHQKPFLALMRSKRITPAEANDFVMARNAEAGNALIRERNPEDAGETLTRYGMTDEEAQAILKRVAADPRAAAFEELGRRFDALNSSTLDRHVEAGRMTQAQADALLERQPHYAPARTDMRGPDGEPIQMPSGKRQVGKAFQKALGRESRAEHPIAFAFAQAEQAIAQGEINRTRQAFLSMVRAYQDQIGDAIKVVAVPMRRALVNGEVKETFDPYWRGRNDVVVAWEKGKPIGMEFAPEHADLAKALNQLGPNQIEGMTKLAAAFNRARASMITRYRPFFWPRNMIRDVKSAAYLGAEFGTRFAAHVVGDVPRALGTLSGRTTELTPYVERYKAAGGPITYLGLRDLESQLNKMQAALAKPDALSTDKNVEGFMAIKRAMETASDIGENATRFSAFVHAIKDLGWTDERAAAYAKELQNFERKGLQGAQLSAWYLFANAGIQTGRRLAQALRHPAVRKTLALSFVASMGWDSLQRAIGGQAPDGEDWWDKIPEYEKQGNFVFMYPDGSGRRLNIPAPFAFGSFNYTGQQLGALLTGNIGPGKFVLSSTEAWVNALNPLGSISGGDAQGLVRSLTPDIGRLPLELATNRDWRGKQIAPEGSPNAPSFARAWPDTNPLAKAVSEWANSVSGGDKYEKGSVDVTPEALEHVADFFGSGLPADVVSVTQQGMKLARGEPIASRDVPMLKQIIRDPSPFASWGEQEELLYSLKAEAKRAEDEKRKLSKEARAVIELGDEVRLDREHVKNPKKGKGTPLDEMDERAKQQALQRLDLKAQSWNRKAREALRKLGR